MNIQFHRETQLDNKQIKRSLISPVKNYKFLKISYYFTPISLTTFKSLTIPSISEEGEEPVLRNIPPRTAKQFGDPLCNI